MALIRIATLTGPHRLMFKSSAALPTGYDQELTGSMVSPAVGADVVSISKAIPFTNRRIATGRAPIPPAAT